MTATWCALCFSLWIAIPVAAHNGEPIPKPGPPHPPAQPVAPAIVKHVEPLRWSWVHWWEANRDSYLHALRQGEALQPPEDAQLAALRKRATDDLVAGLNDQPIVRPEAAMALGHMRATTALPALKQTAANDPDEKTRAAAIIAIGLLDSEESEAFLVSTTYPTTALHVAGLTALGMLSEPSPAAITGLHQAIAATDAPRATAAAWALEHHSKFADDAFLLDVLRNTDSAWLASAAILALGKRNDPRHIPILRDILLDEGFGKSMPVRKRLVDMDQENQRIARQATLLTINRRANQQQFERNYQRYVEQHKRFYKGNPNAPPAAPKPLGVLPGGTVTVGIERIYLARLRASAAIALGNINHPDSTAALLEALKLPDDAYITLPKAMAIMSLGELAHPRALGALLDVLGDWRDLGQPDARQVLRGHAALALGLYAKPHETTQGPQDRPGFDAALVRLAERLNDRRENDEVRAACAMALGLAQRTANLRALQPFSETLTRRDELLAGYTLLARAMIGDTNIIEPCAVLLDVSNDKTDTVGILTRRAATLALGLTGRTPAVPVLIEKAWHLNYYVNREAAMAMSLLGSPMIAESVVTRFEQSTDPAEREFLAKVIGELLTAERPSRLSWLIQGSNYTMKNEWRLPYQTMANEFLFAYLIPAFGATWY